MGPERSVAPFLKASSPHKEAVRPEGSISTATQEGQEEQPTGEDRGGGATTVGGACAPTVEVSRPGSSSNGLGYQGEPAEPEEDKEDQPRKDE